MFDFISLSFNKTTFSVLQAFVIPADIFGFREDYKCACVKAWTFRNSSKFAGTYFFIMNISMKGLRTNHYWCHISLISRSIHHPSNVFLLHTARSSHSRSNFLQIGLPYSLTDLSFRILCRAGKNTMIRICLRSTGEPCLFSVQNNSGRNTSLWQKDRRNHSSLHAVILWHATCHIHIMQSWILLQIFEMS